MRFSSSLRYTLPWMHAELEELMEIFEGDPWPYGLEANRHVLSTLVQYLIEQRLLDRPLSLEELFVPLMLLGE
jgi:4,5-dihydroxyphthalate decarboxylase